MESSGIKKAMQNMLPKGLVQLGLANQNQLIKLLEHLIQTGQLPDKGISDFEIQFIINYLASMDSNHFQNKVGVGEREGRVFSSLVQARYFGMTHGQGRSGNLVEIQPKAAGSSVMQITTHKILKYLMRQIGFKNLKDIIIYPFATGMALTQCLMLFKHLKKEATKVVILRIDQKTCYKCIEAACLDSISIDNILNDDQQLDANLSQLELILQNDKDILCVISVTSCFAPWQPDDVIQIGQLCWKYHVFHLVNNAYGIQCWTTSAMISKSMEQNLIDLCVSSTDKNFMVPVGGSLVYSQNKKYILQLQNLYPGRCSINIIMDIFITLLSMGKSNYEELLNQWEQNFKQLQYGVQLIADKVGELIIDTPWNKISISMTIKNLKGYETEFGSQLFHRGVMGAWVVSESSSHKTFQNVKLKNFGSHLDQSDSILPYITVAAAIGQDQGEVAEFLQKFEKLYTKFLTKSQSIKKIN